MPKKKKTETRKQDLCDICDELWSKLVKVKARGKCEHC